MRKEILLVIAAAAAFLGQPAFTAQPNSMPVARPLASDSDIVAFNWSNSKYHTLSCIWACRCTVHCVNITRAEAHKRGGIPCKVCGGGE